MSTNKGVTSETGKSTDQVVDAGSDRSVIMGITSVAAFIGGLCCFSPIVLVLLGLGTVSTAASLADTLYYGYAWAFRGAAIVFILGAIGYYFYFHEDVCTIDEFKRNRNRIINITAITLITATLAYLIWLYLILEIIGIILGIWEWYW